MSRALRATTGIKERIVFVSLIGRYTDRKVVDSRQSVQMSTPGYFIVTC